MFQLLLVLVYVWPMIHVLISPRSVGGARFGWFVLMFLFSWLAYPFYLITTQKNLLKKN